MKSAPILEVAAGIIQHNGKILIAQRPLGGHRGLCREFAGGKREKGESFEKCLHRELHEELGMRVRVREKLMEVVHAYPERSVRLCFFSCDWLEDGPSAVGCHDFRWITPDRFGDCKFSEADEKILAWLRTRNDVGSREQAAC